MKAREYFQFLLDRRAAGEDERTALGHLIQKMTLEVDEMIEKRGNDPSVVVPILKEMNDRWNAIRRWDPTLARDGFLALIRHRAIVAGISQDFLDRWFS